MIPNKRKVLCKAPSDRKDGGDRRRSSLDLQIRKEDGTLKKKPNKKREREREKKKRHAKTELGKTRAKTQKPHKRAKCTHARTHTNTQSPGLRIQKT
jgi:hypothetical protein